MENVSVSFNGGSSVSVNFNPIVDENNFVITPSYGVDGIEGRRFGKKLEDITFDGIVRKLEDVKFVRVF